MNLNGNTILITGGGSGIGRGLAEAFQKQGNQVIIAGRRLSALDEVTASNPGMKSVQFDVENGASIAPFAEKLIAAFPALNAVIHNAGIMRMEDLKAGAASLPDTASLIATNISGVLQLNAALLPHFLEQPRATVITVSSGLAFLPLSLTPTYCGTKAFIHSWSQSLRYQLKDTKVEVLEIAPPMVATELMGPAALNDPRAMPLADFVSETMQVLANPPASGEILTTNVEPLRWAEKNGSYEQIFNGLNSGAH